MRPVCAKPSNVRSHAVSELNTQRPVQFEIMAAAREAVEAWIRKAKLPPPVIACSPAGCTSPRTLGARQYAPHP